MTGYTRNDTSNNIADGNIINAADLDGEFDALQAAFNSATGHTHDGTSANGAPITKVGPTQDVVVSTTAVTPKTTNTVDLGSSGLQFKDLYIDGTASIDTLSVDINATIGGTLTVTGNATFNGNVTLGNAATDTVAFTADIASNFIPSLDNTYDLGAVGSEWKDLYITGTANIDSLVADTADINGGTIDGASIGATTPSTAAFTTASATTFTGALTGNASTATTLQTARTINTVSFNGSANIIVEPYIEDDDTSNAARYLVFTDDTTAGHKRLNEDSSLYYNPSTNTLTVGTVSGALSGNASTATTLQTARTINGVGFNGSANITVEPYIEDDETSNATRYLVFTDSSGAGYKRLNEDSSLTYNPSSNTLTAGSFVGDLTGSVTGNASTATTLQTARTISLNTGATGTATSFNGSANISIPVTGLNAGYLNSGTVPDARLTGTYTNITLQTNGGNTHYTTPNSGSASVNDRTVFGLAQYKSDSSTATGAIVFYAPNTNNTIMHRLRIEGMIYAGGPTVCCIVQGYRTTGAWSNTSKINLGITDVQVRLGVDPSGKQCVILGDVGTVWSYPMMAITHAMFSHTGVTDAYCKDWTVGLVTSLTGFTNVTATIANSALNTHISGNAITASTFLTARTINGVSFNGSSDIVVEPYVEDAGTASATRYVTFVDNTTAGYKRLNEDSDFTYNPGTNTLTAGTFSGALSGNASTATTLQTARTINGTSFNGSANITTSNWGTARTINGVSVNGSTNYTLEPYIEDDETSNATRYLVFTDTTTAGYKRLNEDSGLNYNPSTGRLTATSFAGDGSNLTGLASTVADGCIYENNQTINSNYTMTTNKNGVSVGPITIASGVTVTIPSGSNWVVL